MEDAVQRAVGRTKAAMQKQGASQRLRVKGIYQTRIRALVQRLAVLGCAARNIGTIIQSVGPALNVQVKERISKTQVARVIAEGGIIAEMQLGHAVATCKSKFCAPLPCSQLA